MSDLKKYGELIEQYAKSNYKKMFREPAGILKYKFIVPGAMYHLELWDWDSWLTNLALREVCEEEISEYEQGCVLNYLDHIHEDGWMPITITSTEYMPPFGTDPVKENLNTHKPCLAQHALFAADQCGSIEWLRASFPAMQRYLQYYFDHYLHAETGLYAFLDDTAIGVDNDPCIFNRPEKSSGSIYLNCLMYKELLAASELAKKLGLKNAAEEYAKKAADLKTAVQTWCWDERDGFYYSVDLNLVPQDPKLFLHSGHPRFWPCLIQRIDSWSGFMALWAGIATPEQAERIILRARDERTFCAPYGIRSLSKLEKMYDIQFPGGNPSCWLGPIWGIANYMTFRGMLEYGFIDDARALAEKTVTMFGRDVETTGEFHEYYDPDSGLGVNGPGFQSWNLLAVNMVKWLRETE